MRLFRKRAHRGKCPCVFSKAPTRETFDGGPIHVTDRRLAIFCSPADEGGGVVVYPKRKKGTLS